MFHLMVKMTERPPTRPANGSALVTNDAPQSQACMNSKSSSPPSPCAPPPLSPGEPQKESRGSLETAGSRRSTRSHQEYLDSLPLPSNEDFARLASVQEQRERERKRHSRELQCLSEDLAKKSSEARQEFMDANRHHHLRVILTRHSRSSSRHDGAAETDGNEEKVKFKAATLIQSIYRGYRVRREMKGLGLDASTRWTHALRDARWKYLNTPRARIGRTTSSGRGDEEVTSDALRPRTSTSAARQKWKKVAMIARRAGADEDSSRSDHDSTSSSDVEDNAHLTGEQKTAAREKREARKAQRRKKAKMMGLQYFLEMVDVKHRYGSNLRQYHEEWKRSGTNENYFYWLDYGGGKDVELESCPRDRLEREQVRYLSREERQYYLVNVDEEGRLCWTKNGARIDTTEEYKDSIHGIVPVDDPTPAFAPQSHAHPQDQETTTPGTDSSPDESEQEAARAAKYATPTFDRAKGIKKVKRVSAATIFNKLLRKSVKRNTWIFVADTSFRLYVGIKNSGGFQHSSFLQGSRISAAGLIKIKNGRLSSLSPLSGHYRPPASNFRAFVHSLKDEGVDMSHVSISKSYAVLVGLEAYVKTQKKSKKTWQKLTHQREKLLYPEEARRKEEAAQDKSESAIKERQFLEKQEEEQRDENRVGGKLMRKLGLGPKEPVSESKNT